MSDDTGKPEDTAQGFFWNAMACAAFADAAMASFSRDNPAEVAVEARRLDTHYGYIRKLLLAQGIELAVKAWFLQRGLSVSELKRRAFGHDLVALFQRASREGFPLNGHAEMWVLTMLNGVYRDDKELQHPKPPQLAWPSSLAVRELLHESLRAACASIYPLVDLEKVRLARDPGRWLGLRTDALNTYGGPSLADMRLGTAEALPALPAR